MCKGEGGDHGINTCVVEEDHGINTCVWWGGEPRN